MGYLVYENDKPAIIKGSQKGWDNNFFEDFQDAVKYVEDWLGMYNPGLPPNWQGEPFDYGYGDKMEIRFQDGIETP